MTTISLIKYRNGNADVELFSDGTRVIEYEGSLSLEWPLNIDVRVSTQCSFGFNPKTETTVCDFCHEGARVDGVECSFIDLINILEPIPKGIEIAIGSNKLTSSLLSFLMLAKLGFLFNLTINQGHLPRDIHRIRTAIELDLIKGLGVSYREGMVPIPSEVLRYSHTVVHVIAGIDSIDNVRGLANQGVTKLLVLGEKDFGFNSGRVNLKSASHLKWYREIRTLFDIFEVVSFDNLAIEQLKPQRFISQNWSTLYQGEHSMYINAVAKTFAPSSRSFASEPWSDIHSYFNTLEKERNEHLLST